MFGKHLLGIAGARHEQCFIVIAEGVQSGLFQHPAIHSPVEIVAAEGGVVVGGEHFENALGQLEDGNIECAAAQVTTEDPASAWV